MPTSLVVGKTKCACGRDAEVVAFGGAICTACAKKDGSRLSREAGSRAVRYVSTASRDNPLMGHLNLTPGLPVYRVAMSEKEMQDFLAGIFNDDRYGYDVDPFRVSFGKYLS